ncbi:MAG: recombinase family protein, partial [Cytophagaceae bacterium]|nr:recombinase family protein [Cytophagaceae bacterium]
MTAKSENQIQINNLLKKFAKEDASKNKTKTNNCVIYTRVSTKEQADNNLSLQTQRKACELFAEKNNLKVVSYFGGTYESAKSDERDEFKRMISFVKKSSEQVSYIIVYSVDRFSRSGANAIYIASNLKKEGVSVMAVTQPTDSNTASGTLQQNIQFIFSEYDNQMRREKCMAGTKEKLLTGEWCGRQPFGYDSININGVRKIVVNEKGKLVRKAFEWKANEGIPNTEIQARLKSMGLKIHKQLLTRIFNNPFYCGLISHNFLDGELIEGSHDPLVSKELFLKANNMSMSSHNGWKVTPENDNLPLKRFLKCEKCGSSFRGYLVKRKNIHYYKCGKTGCCVNENAGRLHEMFEGLLAKFELNVTYIGVVRAVLKEALDAYYEANRGAVNGLKARVTELGNNLSSLKERYALGKVDDEIFQEFSTKYKEQLKEAEKELSQLLLTPSNLDSTVDKALEIAINLRSLWRKSSYCAKQKLQYLLFPQGVRFSKDLQGCRTVKVHKVFELIQYAVALFEERKWGPSNFDIERSPYVQ